MVELYRSKKQERDYDPRSERERIFYPFFLVSYWDQATAMKVYAVVKEGKEVLAGFNREHIELRCWQMNNRHKQECIEQMDTYKEAAK